MKYLIDTNIVLVYLRDDKTKGYIEANYAPFHPSNILIVSVVSLGEIESIGLRNKWGIKRLNAVDHFFRRCVIADINTRDVIKRYGEIDAYSQGKLPNCPKGMSSKNMGKNDLWIAATASATGAKLLTMDKDFERLDGVHLEVIGVELVR
jgi:tRNA(fMet)-specific endonuclease VapC